MEVNKRVYELFESQKDFYEKTVSEGIERNRKGMGAVTLLDKSGKPIKNARIKLTQKSHEFRFGANIFMLDELETEEKNEKYKSCFAELFNMATLPFYWNTLEPERGKPRYAKDSPKIYRRPPIDLCMEYCEKHGIEPREHALAYDAHFPEWIRGLSREETLLALENRYREISERYADKIPTIEVTNEMLWAKGVSALYDEPDYVADCFKLAERYFPNNKLCINEATGYCWTDVARSSCSYYAYTEAAMLKGARIDSIGMQYHIFTEKGADNYFKLLDLESLWQHMELFSKLGKPLQITEITVPSYSWEEEDEELQADIIEHLYSLWFSHPAVEQIIYWNVVDGYAHLWSNDQKKIRASQGNMGPGSENFYHGGLLRYDMSEKPAYKRLKHLIYNRWHTKESLVTDENGKIDFCGFYGDYELIVDLEGRTEKREIKLSCGKENCFKLSI